VQYRQLSENHFNKSKQTLGRLVVSFTSIYDLLVTTNNNQGLWRRTVNVSVYPNGMYLPTQQNDLRHLLTDELVARSTRA